MSPGSTSISGCVVESPSHYPAPADPVDSSAVSSVLISPKWFRDDCSSVTLEEYLVYEVSPNTTGYAPTITLATSPPSEVSLPPLVLDSLPLGAPVSLGGVVACDITVGPKR